MENGHKYDVLRMYFGDVYYAAPKICIHQPTINDIIEYGEMYFWNTVAMICGNPTTFRLQLWHSGVDWNKISDFELFSSFIVGMECDKTKIFFGDLDFTKMRPIENDDGNLVLVYMPDPEIQIDEEIYTRMINYIRLMVNYYPKVEHAKNKSTKEALIWEDEMNAKNSEKLSANEKFAPSTLFSLISAALNHPGFKYKKTELRNVGIFEFMDSVRRLQVYESTTSLMSGMYSGMLDTSKLKLDKELNWARDMYSDDNIIPTNDKKS